MEERIADTRWSPRDGDRPDLSRVSREQRIEHLVGAIGQIIQEAEPSGREDLKDFAETLLRQETAVRPPISSERRNGLQARRRQNPLAAGLLLLIPAAGLAFVSMGIGLMLGCIALALIVWGGIMSGVRT